MQTLPTLPLHLMLSWSSLQASIIASDNLKSVLSAWKTGSPNNPLSGLAEAVRDEAQSHYRAVLAGVERYAHATPLPRLAEPPVVWRQGAARLLDYSSQKARGAPLLLVPSLINRYHVLDLAREQSLARYLAGKGIPVLLLDWGAPGQAEMGYDCGGYVTGPLLGALRFAAVAAGRRVILAGYCMGGVLALALAQLAAREVRALALLATPWDFFAHDMPAPRLPEEGVRLLEESLSGGEAMEPAQVLAMFYLTDPWRFEEKFIRFGAMKEGSEEYNAFLALEGWVNDGVPLAPRVARECLAGWAQRNMLMNGRWKIDGQRIDPARLSLPCFAVVPTDDRIVPRGCALPLVDELDDCELIQPSAGHVGMVVGRRAKNELWKPLREWVEEIG